SRGQLRIRCGRWSERARGFAGTDGAWPVAGKRGIRRWATRGLFETCMSEIRRGSGDVARGGKHSEHVMRATATHLPGSVLLVAVALFGLCSGASAQPDLAELVRPSNVIVGATVVRLRASNVSAVPASDHTMVVKVGRVYDAPRSIATLRGAEI